MGRIVMFAKLFVTILFAAVLGAVLLGFRQQRLQTMHEMALMHAEMDRARRQTWDLQVRIAERIEPEALNRKLQRNELTVEPSVADAPPRRSVVPRIVERQSHRE